MRRIVLFVATNMAILFVLNLVLIVAQNVFHFRIANGGGLLIMAAVLGMGGSFLSLALSKWIAKMQTGAQVINEPRSELERWLVATVRRQSAAVGIGMPEVAIYDAPEMNAFATGMSRDSALVAVSTGLLRNMERREVEAVLGHEISHVANGDMVTMSLLQGVLNTFVIFAARVVGGIVDSALSGDRENRGGGLGYFVVVTILQVLFGFLASLIVMAFSRWREFRADAGGGALEGRAAMIAALQRLSGNHGVNTLPEAVQAFGISGGGGLARLLMSHPPIEERIAALRQA